MADVIGALRRLRSSPGFSLFAVLTLALGIGATSAIYSTIYAVVLRPPAVADLNRIVNIYHSRPPGSGSTVTLSWPDYRDLRAQQSSFDAVAAWTRFRQGVTGAGVAELVMGEAVGGEYLKVLGVEPAAGRLLQPADDTLSSGPVAVISHALWRRWFNSDPAAIGRTIKLGGVACEIVGVAPASFRGVDMPNVMPTPMWIPLSVTFTSGPTGADVSFLEDRERRFVFVKARLRADRTIARAIADVTAIAGRLDTSQPIGRDVTPRYGTGAQTRRAWYVMPAGDMHVHETVDAVAMPLAAATMIAVVLVLLVACTNLANLTLARNASRAQERAVRAALGASRWRLIRTELVESAIVAVAGGAAGAIVARALMIVLSGAMHLAPGIVVRLDPSFNLSVVLMTVGATGLTMLVFGVWPAWQATRLDVRSQLASEGAGASPRWRARRGLVAAQVLVSTVLITLAALSVQQVQAAAQHDPGFSLDRLSAAQADFRFSQIDEVRARRVMDRALERTRVLGGVESAALVSALPLGMNAPSVYLGSADRPLIDDRIGGVARFIVGSPDMFRVMGVRIVHGRGFEDRDAAGSQPVAVVSAQLALTMFGTRDAVGRQLQVRVPGAGRAAEAVEIVGIAADTDGPIPGRRSESVLYRSYAQTYSPTMAVVAATSEDPAALAGTLRATLTSVDPDVVIFDSGSGTVLAGADGLSTKVTAVLSGLLGTLAFVLALAGLYGVLSQVIAQRTREIGLRLALGAGRARIIRMVILQGVIPVALGLAAGLGIGTLIRSSLRGVIARLFPALDPITLAVVPAALLIAAGVACYVPARRAAGVDPNVALRQL